MRVGGRPRPSPRSTGVTGTVPRLLCLAAALSVTGATPADYGVPIEIKVWDTGRTPLAHMVDVTNSFGLKVLAEHNFLNDNNIAFSPYGLLGILVALYEGIDGESSFQVQRAMALPWQRNVMRIGFRDIHRTLKTYFVPEEGFLAGLALNNENVTFNEDYKKILRFYGFDLDNNDQLPTLAPTNSTNETTTMAPGTTPAGTSMDTGSTQAREDPTTNPNAETINDVDIREQSTSVSPSSAPNSEATTSTPTESVVTTTQSTVSAETTTQSTVVMETTTATVTTTTSATQTTPTTTTMMQNDTEVIPSASTTELTDEPTANNEVEDTTPVTTTASEPASTLVVNGEGDATPQSTGATESSTMTAETQSETTTLDVTTAASSSTLETLQRRKKSIVDFIYTNPPYVDDYLYHRSFDIPIDPDPANPNFGGNKMFLVNGLRNVQVTYMFYDTVLEHAYLPHLEASALRLPLDSDRYYLLVVLPTRMGGPELGRLLARMARESDLSDVCSALRPKRVRAVVPSFTVKGHVTLTTDLQKLGIRDVFEPRQRDFIPMTSQPGVYVRSIEQAVSVAIRKYRSTDTNSSKYLSNRPPVSFSATYPFLYFVMDASIHVALMAGKMVDPLNSRIL